MLGIEDVVMMVLYRVKLRNASDDIHPLHLHRHSFE
jgi:FtsP/CotA-like multicopper oxidase with cupredoxin domain